MVRLMTILLAAVLFGLGACSSTASLRYVATHAVMPGPPGLIAGVSVMDVRDQRPYRFLFAPGVWGNSPTVHDTPCPVADEVAAVFTKALRVRGMLAASAAAPYRLQLMLRTLRGDGYPGLDAEIAIDMAVVDQSKQTIYRNTVGDARQFPPSDDDGAARALVQVLLNATVDSMLDNPGFRTAIRPH